MPGPLEGIRVLDWTIWQQGPVCSLMLGDMGADVIKIEELASGDPGRHLFGIGGKSLGQDFYFEANNHNKKSITLDLTSADGQAELRRLAAGVDVLVDAIEGCPIAAPDLAAEIAFGARLRSYRFDEGTALGHRLVELRQSLSQRSLLLVLSDLHDPSGVRALKLLGQEHDVIALQLQDPAELGLGRVGFLRGQEAETGRTFVTTGRQSWVDPLLVERELRKAGVDHLVLRTDQPFVARLRHFLSSRGVLSGGAR